MTMLSEEMEIELDKLEMLCPGMALAMRHKLEAEHQYNLKLLKESNKEMSLRDGLSSVSITRAYYGDVDYTQKPSKASARSAAKGLLRLAHDEESEEAVDQILINDSSYFATKERAIEKIDPEYLDGDLKLKQFTDLLGAWHYHTKCEQQEAMVAA